MDLNNPIHIIEHPCDETLKDYELSAILGGWNCGSYTKHSIFNSTCNEWNSGSCTDRSQKNYCEKYSKGKKQAD